MVSYVNNTSKIVSPNHTDGGGLRGVTKQSSVSSRFADTKTKKVQRALCTLFEESALKSSPLLARKVRTSSPNSRPYRCGGILNPAIGRLRMQEARDMPVLRKATPIKDKQDALHSAFGRHRLTRDLDALADELGTCQLQSAMKATHLQPEPNEALTVAMDDE